MGLARAVQNSTHSGQEITWTGDDGAAHDLSGATLSGFIRGPDGNTRAITGILAVTDAEAGVFTWAYTDADVATAGRHKVQFKAVYSDSKPDRTYQGSWDVEEDLEAGAG